MGQNAAPATPALDLLVEVGTRIAAADPLHSVLDEIVQFVTEFVSCDSCFLYVVEGDDLVLRASKNPHAELLDELKLHRGKGITGWVAERSEPVVLTHRASSDPRFQSVPELPEDSYEAFLSIPVVSRGRVVGVLNVQNRNPYMFSAREIKAITTIGHLVGSAIEMARLEAEVHRLSDKLAARKLVERAKGVLQRELGVSEEEAYTTLQKSARQRRKSMREISEAVILADEMKRAPKPA